MKTILSRRLLIQLGLLTAALVAQRGWAGPVPFAFWKKADVETPPNPTTFQPAIAAQPIGAIPISGTF